MNSYADIPYVDDRLKSDKATTFLGFVDDLRKLWQTAGNPGDIVRHNNQKDSGDHPIITYRIKHRLPHPSFKETKPRIRQTIDHPYRPNEKVELYGQVFQVIVEFNIFSPSDDEADEITVQLEEFINGYKIFFLPQGVKDINFLEQGEDTTYNEYSVPLAKRTIYFDMQFEKVLPRYLNQIDQLAIQASILNKSNEDNKEES